MTDQDRYIEKLMDQRFQESLNRLEQTDRLSGQIQRTSALLLIFSVLLLAVSLLLGLPGLFYLISGGVIAGLLLAALVTASIIHLWPAVTSYPPYDALRNRIRKAEDDRNALEEYMDMTDGALELMKRTLVRRRAILLAALVCLYAAIACLTAAFIVGICLWF